jgi:hypothetical protein
VPWPLPGWVRTDHVVTLHVALVIKIFGRTSDAIRGDIARALCAFMRAPSADAA